MGWQDRDWAKFTDAERRRIYGGSPSGGNFSAGNRGTSLTRTRGRLRASNAAVLVVLVSVAVLAAGHLPKTHPLVPALHFTLPARASGAESGKDHSPRFDKLGGPGVVRAGSVITTRGSLASSVSGPVVVQGRWKLHGWKTLGGTYMRSGAYQVTYPLRHRGVVRIRISLPDGTFAITKIRVI